MRASSRGLAVWMVELVGAARWPPRATQHQQSIVKPDVFYWSCFCNPRWYCPHATRHHDGPGLFEGEGLARGGRGKAMKTIGPLDPEDPSPLYMRVERALREAVRRGDLEPGMAVPPERDLADTFGVSRITIRKALGGLVDQGLLTRRQGAGTFVAASVDRIEKSLSKIGSFSEDMASRGLKPSSTWLSKASGTVTPEEALMFGLSPGEPVY